MKKLIEPERTRKATYWKLNNYYWTKFNDALKIAHNVVNLKVSEACHVLTRYEYHVKAYIPRAPYKENFGDPEIRIVPKKAETDPKRQSTMPYIVVNFSPDGDVTNIEFSPFRYFKDIQSDQTGRAFLKLTGDIVSKVVFDEFEKYMKQQLAVLDSFTKKRLELKEAFESGRTEKELLQLTGLRFAPCPECQGEAFFQDFNEQIAVYDETVTDGQTTVDLHPGFMIDCPHCRFQDGERPQY
jgi:hypothetical protein